MTAGASGVVPPLVFPRKHAGVTAEVLRRFLAGERLTSLDAVAGASTTRLAAVAHYLTSAYGWPIESKDKAVGCRDGRTAHVSEYYLAPLTIQRAAGVGAADWCASVRAARALQRARVATAG